MTGTTRPTDRNAGRLADDPPAVAPRAEGPQGGIAATAREIWRDERVEVVAAVLLSLATVLSAWGAYQATRWSGEQANNYAEAAALRAVCEQPRDDRFAPDPDRRGDVHRLVRRHAGRATLGWRITSARGSGRNSSAPFDAWLASRPPDASGLPPGTPFDRP